MRERIKNQKGFTLVEIMMVVIIIGILAVLAIPRYEKYTIESKLAEVAVAVGEIKTGMEKYYNSHGNSYTSIPAVTYNQHLMSALRIDLGEQENFRFEIVHSEANGRTGYIIYAILTTIGLQDYASSDVGDQSVFFFPSKLNSDWEKAEWAKGWNDDSFFD